MSQFISFLDEKGNWRVLGLGFKDSRVELFEEKLGCQESFVGGEIVEKLDLRFFVYDKDLIVRNGQNQEVRYQATRKLKKYLLDTQNNNLIILDRGRDLYFFNLKNVNFSEQDPLKLSLKPITNHLEPILSMSIEGNGQFYVQGGDQGMIKVFDSGNLHRLLNVSVQVHANVKQILSTESRIFFVFRNKAAKSFEVQHISHQDLLLEHFKGESIYKVENSLKFRVAYESQLRQFVVFNKQNEQQGTLQFFDENFKLLRETPTIDLFPKRKIIFGVQGENAFLYQVQRNRSKDTSVEETVIPELQENLNSFKSVNFGQGSTFQLFKLVE